MFGVGWISIDSAIDKQSLFLCLLHGFFVFFLSLIAVFYCTVSRQISPVAEVLMMNNFCIWLLIVFSWISLAQSQCVDRLNSICSQAMVTNSKCACIYTLCVRM